MPRKRLPLTDQLRRAINAAGMSRYRLCKIAGLSQATMSRFMSGKGGLSMEMMDRIGEALRLNIVADEPAGGEGER